MKISRFITSYFYESFFAFYQDLFIYQSWYEYLSKTFSFKFFLLEEIRYHYRTIQLFDIFLDSFVHHVKYSFCFSEYSVCFTYINFCRIRKLTKSRLLRSCLENQSSFHPALELLWQLTCSIFWKIPISRLQERTDSLTEYAECKWSIEPELFTFIILLWNFMRDPFFIHLKIHIKQFYVIKFHWDIDLRFCFETNLKFDEIPQIHTR